MKRRAQLVIVFAFVLCCSSTVPAQDPHFSQFYGNPLYLNPALAGNKICPRITLNYRDQWPNIPATFVTYGISFDRYIEPISGALALMAVRDDAGKGILTNTMLSGIYSYRLEMTRDLLLNAGFQATVQQINLDWDKLTFENPQEIPSDGFQRKIIPDFSAGFVLGFAYNYFFGFAAHHLTQPEISYVTSSSDGPINRQDLKLTIHAGAIFDLVPASTLIDADKVPTISPNILFQQQGAFKQVNVGLYSTLHPFTFGVWYRHTFRNQDAAIVLLGIEYQGIKIGYSYDYTVSALTNATGGSHEVSLGWIFNCDDRVKNRKIKAIKVTPF